MLKKIILFIGVCYFSNDVVSQTFDTLKLMTYNLMYYRETTSFCTNSNNNPTSKDGYMATIIDYTLPDILVVNELGGSNAALNSFRLLSNSLNQNGRSNYSFANATSNSNLANMIYFNSNKLGLKEQQTVTQDLNGGSLIRLIDIYTLYHIEPNLAQHQDTTFLHIVAAHLKAGSSNADATERHEACQSLMSFLAANNMDGNVFMLGDFNLYRSGEAAFQELLNYSQAAYRFRDPINLPGNWGNSAYASFHTQSTRTSGSCFSTGGMDDRFDFILVSDEVMNQAQRVKYLSGSYTTVGQDGNRYNGSLISPTNNSAPSNVINALYNMSDHLPVTIEVEVMGPTGLSLESSQKELNVRFQNPTTGYLSIELSQAEILNTISIQDLSGKTVAKKAINNSTTVDFDLNHLSRGVYFINLQSKSGNQQVKKLIKI